MDVDDKGSRRKIQDDKRNQLHFEEGTKVKLKKPKKGNLLIRKLSFNKFRTSPEPEPRHTPEGGDSSRSPSQSSQESASRLSTSSTTTSRKGSDQEKSSTLSLPIAKEKAADEKGVAKKGEVQLSQQEQLPQQKSEKLIDKPVSTIIVVQRKSPSVTIRSTNLQEQTTKLQQHGESVKELHRIILEIYTRRERVDIHLRSCLLIDRLIDQGRDIVRIITKDDKRFSN